MSEDQNNIVTLKVRVTAEFREKIATTAKENNRSMNAEIVHRLEQSFADQITPHIKPLSQAENSADLNDPNERARLAKLAATQALKEMPAQELFKLITSSFGEVHLTLEEVDKLNELKTKKPI